MNHFVQKKRILTLLNVVVLVNVIWLYHVGFLDSVPWMSFIMLSIGIFILALYYPMIVFSLFIGTIPLEIINIAPDYLTSALRPYQFLGVVLFCTVLVRHVVGMSKQKFLTWGFFDILITIFIGFGFVHAIFIDNTTLKQLLIVLSFGLLYFVVRYFVRTKDDVLALLPILVSSAVVIALYGIVQNVMSLTGGVSGEVMLGRPNATFAEPDWLGMYLVFGVGVLLTYLYYSAYHKHVWKFFDGALYASGMAIFVTLIITVARSAWIGVVVVIFGYLLIIFLQKKYKLFAMHSFWIVSVGLLSMIVVLGFHLTNFELFNRVQSTHSGLQGITVACEPRQTRESVPAEISDVSELEQYGCAHINLEDITNLESQGYSITKVYRNDPNVKVRADVYARTIALIAQKPLMGYGWGSSSTLLGNDESGTPLNASNIFLETALSVGLIGTSVLIIIFLSIIIFAVTMLWTSNNMKEKSIAIFAIVGVVAIIVPNLFNAGLFLGFVWVFLGLIDSVRKT